MAAKRRASTRIWRGAAIALLAGGIALALWFDPALLDQRAVKLALAGAFAVLWMVPVVFPGRSAPEGAPERAPAGAGPSLPEPILPEPVLPAPKPRDPRAVIDVSLGALAGLLAGALYLSFPGSAALLGRGPELVDAGYGAAGAYGPWAVIGGALLVFVLIRLALGWLGGAVRSSRFGAAFVMALCLWVPFHESFAAGFRLIGVTLPGLSGPEMGEGA